ncbi:aldehyde dehydrogenase family protein [Sphingomonas canadensis]|uniref:Aldehyde dehydrogenase family protein n=1 Tax=Sphingomonas canadensis TaxID=1219257 RepID=A0ABW3H5H1_9SPHN|nr:aldehyde dehydrogenase family protein [Sphingomonas canadensis]MCW3836189.1 aldehyde dehydrogenase family protein [Sphingomonas canadensis]
MTNLSAINPRTGIADFSFEAASREQIAAAAAAAREAQPGWSALTIEGRIALLMRWVEQIRLRRVAIAEALTLDTGRRRISYEEVDVICHMVEGHAERARVLFNQNAAEIDAPKSGGGVDFEPQLVPYGVTGVISPWNFPVILSFIDAIPALLAGNAVIIKPSEVTPRFVTPLAEAIAAVPELDGIITLVLGDAQTGQALIENVDLIIFTGSVANGRKVAESAARRLIPAFLELGGKDPAIVLPGADLERAATAIVRSAVYNSGQVCYSIERVYVHDDIHDAFVGLLAEKAAALDINHPDIGRGEIGPFIHQRQAEIVREQIEDAVQKGACILTGGRIEEHDGGRWLRATVIDGINHGMRLMTDETFGPVIPVMRFASEDEAVALANDTIFGLSGAVFAATLEEGTALARRINAGGISINDTELTRAITFSAEKNAFACSGLGGSRYGTTATFRYMRKKALIRNGGAVKDLSALSEHGG